MALASPRNGTHSASEPLAHWRQHGLAIFASPTSSRSRALWSRCSLSLKVIDYRFVPGAHPTFHPGRCAVLEVGIPDAEPAQETEATDAPDGLSLPANRGKFVWMPVAVLGEAHPDIAERFDVTIPHMSGGT